MADTYGLSTVLAVNDGSSGAQTEILYVLEIEPPEPEIEHAPAGYLNQGNRNDTSKPVRCKQVPWSFLVKYDSTERARMVTLWNLTLNSTCPIFRITWSDTVTHTVSSWVTKVGAPRPSLGQLNTVRVDLLTNGVITVGP